MWAKWSRPGESYVVFCCVFRCCQRVENELLLHRTLWYGGTFEPTYFTISSLAGNVYFCSQDIPWNILVLPLASTVVLSIDLHLRASTTYWCTPTLCPWPPSTTRYALRWRFGNREAVLWPTCRWVLSVYVPGFVAASDPIVRDWWAAQGRRSKYYNRLHFVFESLIGDSWSNLHIITSTQQSCNYFDLLPFLTHAGSHRFSSWWTLLPRGV